MDIKLDDATRAEVIRQAKEQAVAAVVAQFNPMQIAAEIRNEAVKQVARSISDKVYAEPRVQEAIHRAMQAVESRLNTKITATLAKGIVIKLSDDGP